MMKKLWLSILTVLMSLCCVFGFVACKDKEEGKGQGPGKETQKTLVDFTDTELVIEYGDTYTIESYVYDTDGVSYPLTAKITDADGEQVACESVLTVSKATYTVVYSVEINGGTSKKTVTISVSSRPIITLDKEERTFALGVIPYTIPAITVTDDVDGEITEYVKEIYYVNGEQEEKTSYNGTDATFMPDKIGTYYFKVTATNKFGLSNSEQVKFTVREVGVVDFIPSASTATKFTTNITSVPKSEYVAAEDIPTEGIDNSMGYTGNAIKSTQKTGGISYIAMNFSATEYQAMADRGDFNTVELSYLVVSAGPVTNSEKDNLYKGLLTYAGVTGKSPNVITCNAWQRAQMKVEDLCKAMRAGDNDETTLLFARIWTAEPSVDVYLGDIKFVKKAPTLLEVRYADATALQHYRENGEIPSAKPTKIANANLPVKEGYAGDAISLKVGSQCYAYATLNYTKTEIDALKADYVGAELNFMFFDDDGERSYAEGLITAGDVTVNTWIKKTLTLDELQSFMGVGPMASAENKLLLWKGWTNGNLYIYLGDITLVPKTAE